MKKLAAACLLLLTACEGTPREQYVQWVARDAWDSTCAEKAMVEVWKAENKRWKTEGQVYVADVQATFRMTDDCQSGLPIVGKQYKALEKVPFVKAGLEVSRCKKDGADGWALPGKEGSRCWTGPTLLAK
jgi:hypothetical protein